MFHFYPQDDSPTLNAAPPSKETPEPAKVTITKVFDFAGEEVRYVSTPLNHANVRKKIVKKKPNNNNTPEFSSSNKILCSHYKCMLVVILYLCLAVSIILFHSVQSPYSTTFTASLHTGVWIIFTLTTRWCHTLKWRLGVWTAWNLVWWQCLCLIEVKTRTLNISF